MPRHLFKRLAPSPEAIRENKCLQVFGAFIHSPNLWHLNRHAVARAFAAGIFWALIPVPFQMVFSAGTAILWRANLPISVTLVWLTNPLTIPPVFYGTYWIGALIVDAPHVEFPTELDVDWFFASLNIIWKPLFVGSLLSAFVAGVIGYAVIQGFWRWHAVRRYRSRRTVKTAAVGHPESGA